MMMELVMMAVSMAATKINDGLHWLYSVSLAVPTMFSVCNRFYSA